MIRKRDDDGDRAPPSKGSRFQRYRLIDRQRDYRAARQEAQPATFARLSVLSVCQFSFLVLPK